MKQPGIVSLLSFADSFTLVNAILGIFAIFLLFAGYQRWAFSFVLLAVMADGIDGRVARRFGSSVGQYMDEFSDTISFCAAPAVMVFTVYGTSFDPSLPDIAILFGSGLFLLSGMLHLVRYHIGTEPYFVGIATPAAAIMVVSLTFLSPPWWVVVAAMVTLSFLLVSTLPYPPVDGLITLPAVALLIAAVVLADADPVIYLLLAGSIIYAALGPVYISYRGLSALD